MFYGPILLFHPRALMEVIAAHEWAHAYLWCRGEPWLDEHLTDQTIDSWGFDADLLERIRFHDCGRCIARFLTVDEGGSNATSKRSKKPADRRSRPTFSAFATSVRVGGASRP